MKYDVPFHTASSPYDCGPAVVRIALDYLDEDTSIDRIKEIIGYNEGEAVYTIELAILGSKRGFQTSFYTADPWNEHDEEYYEEHGRDFTNEELYQKAKQHDVNLNFEEIGLDEILSHLSENSIPIVLIDWNVVEEGEGYLGHFVPVVGETDSAVIVHEVSDEEGDFLEIEKQKFQEARKSQGTDMDVAILSTDKDT